MLECGLSEEELLDLWINVDECWRRVYSTPQGHTRANEVTTDNLKRIVEIMSGRGITSMVINGILLDACLGNCGDPDCHGSVDMRVVPTVLTSTLCHTEEIDTLAPKKD